MQIYLVAFLVSCFCLWLGQRKPLFLRPFTLIGLLIPIVLAGYRDFTVGTDTIGYYHWFLWYASPELDIFGRREPFFQFFAYIAKQYKFFNIVLIAFEAASVVFLYAACCRLQKMLKPNGIVLSIPFVFFLYYCIDFNMSLNIMRQGTAVVYFVFALTFLLERKYLVYVTLIILGFIFHATILVAGGIILIAYILTTLQFRYRSLMMLGYFGGMLLLGASIGILLPYFAPFLGESWSKAASFYALKNSQVSTILFFATVYTLVLYILCRKDTRLPSSVTRLIPLIIIAEVAFQL